MICADCIGEHYLKARIAADGDDAACTFCGQQSICMDDDDFASLVERAIDEHYRETPREAEGLDALLAREGQWVQPGMPIGELITEITEAADDGIGDRVRAILSDRHGLAAVMDGGEDPYANDAQYEEAPVDTDQHDRSWKQFKYDVLARSRYYNRQVDSVLDDLFGDIHHKRTGDGQPVARMLEPDNDERFVYRARVAASLDDVQAMLESPVAQLGAPPSGVASAGRMNAQGIGVFYSSTDIDTCISEVRPPVGSKAVTARFEIVRALRVLDLAALQRCYTKGSVFDPESLDRWTKDQFLRRLVLEIGRPILPHEETSEYLPTQIISEYLHDRSEPPIDGMLFPSAQRDGQNLVLFHRAARAESYDLPNGSHTWVSWGYGPEDDFVDDISVHEETPAQAVDADGHRAGPRMPAVIEAMFRPRHDPPEDNRDVTLRLELGSIQVHEIRGTTYLKHDRPVAYSRRQARR